MFVQRIWMLLGLFGSVSANEVEYDTNCAENYDNEVGLDQQQGPPSLGPCQDEGPRWDRLFVALEDSHMRQNMLLSSVEQNCGGGGGGTAASLKMLWDKLSRGGCHVCASNMERICTSFAEQTHLRIQREFVEVLSSNAEMERNFNLTLLQVLHRIQETNSRLKRLEEGPGPVSKSGAATTSSYSGVREQEVEDHRWLDKDGSVANALVVIATELQKIQVQLNEVIKETRNKGRGDT